MIIESALGQAAHLEPTQDPKREFEHFLGSAHGQDGSISEAGNLRAFVDLAERYRIRQALEQCRGNRSAAARVLGIGRRTLYAKMEKLGIGDE